MSNEQKIIQTLKLVLEKLDDHSKRFDSIDVKLTEHSEILSEHSNRLDAIDVKLSEHSNRLDAIDVKLSEHSNRLDAIDVKLSEHSEVLTDHSKQLDTMNLQLSEHGQHLSALRTGQEFIKAELDGVKVSHAKEFGTIKGQMEDFSVSFGLLRDDVWHQKVHIERIKNTMGMA